MPAGFRHAMLMEERLGFQGRVFCPVFETKIGVFCLTGIWASRALNCDRCGLPQENRIMWSGSVYAGARDITVLLQPCS